MGSEKLYLLKVCYMSNTSMNKPGYGVNLLILQHRHNTCFIGLMSRVFANGLGDWGSIPGWVIPKTQKIVLDAAFLSTQHYKVRVIKGKVVAIEKGALGRPRLRSSTLPILLSTTKQGRQPYIKRYQVR